MTYKGHTLNAAGYPTDALLKYLRRIARNPKKCGEMFGLIIGAWKYKDCGYYRRRGRRIWLSTAGWSGNESLIDAIDGTFNWFLSAYSWRRGGHYVFTLPSGTDVSSLPETKKEAT